VTGYSSALTMRSRALHLAAACGLAAFLVAACGYPDPTPDNGPVAGTSTSTPTPAAGADDFNEGDTKKPVTFPDGLQIVDLRNGTGATVPAGASVNVQYTGWLASNGQKFDSSRDRNQPLCVILDPNAQQQQGDCTPVIPGFDEGVPGMKVGGRRKLIIPPALGYGSQAQGPIPANSKLVFTIELLGIVASPSPTPTPAASPSPSPRPSP
jgi:FKBP-type peptidyl-prolyl cis-trans isomerase